MSKFIQTQKIKIRTISPIHIGDGNEFNPLTFWIDENSQKLIEFNQKDFLASLDKNEYESFLQICSKGALQSLIELMKLINQKRVKGYRQINICKDIIDTYKRVLSVGDFNNFQIKKSCFSSNNAYIPGSSLKGAIRTAILFSSMPQGDNFLKTQNATDLEKRFLGDNKNNDDLLRKVKVSDFICEDKIETSIAYAIRVSKRTSKEGAPVMLESINAGSIFDGTISLFDDTVLNLLSKLDKYSLTILNDPNIGIASPTILEINKFKSEIKNPTFLCRLGGYIGGESHTIQGYREIKNRKSDKTMAYTTTNIYSSNTKKKYDDNNVSFGWCLIEVVDDKTEVVNEK
jgi:CRISPR-associated protein Csm5